MQDPGIRKFQSPEPGVKKKWVRDWNPLAASLTALSTLYLTDCTL